MNNSERISINDVRAYVSLLMKKAYTSSDISAEDTKSLAALAMELDLFLKNADKKNLATDLLVSEMKKMTAEATGITNSLDTGMMKKQTGVVVDNQKLFTESGKPIYLGTFLGVGGEGSVYKIPGMPGKVAKIYKYNVDLEEKERHIGAFFQNSVPKQIDSTLIATIPEERIYLENGKFVGYIMPHVSSQFKIYDVMRDSQERAKYFPELDYRGLIVIAYNLAEIIHVLHKHNVVVGDMNLGNIIVNTDGTVCLIDADSFDIKDQKTGEHFPCSVGTPELLPPELQLAGKVKGLFTKESDYFSLAIIIFRLLMNNADPFGGISFDDETSVLWVEANNPIVNGECPYVRTIPGTEIPSWVPNFQMLPDRIRELFSRVFCYTKDNYHECIKNRPTAEEWMEALMEYYQSPMNRCDNNAFHYYSSKLSECPFCKATNMANVHSFLSVGI